MTCWRVLCGNYITIATFFHQLVLLKRSLTIDFLTAAKINSFQLSSLISYLGFYHLTFFPSHLISAFTWMSSCWKSIRENYVGEKKKKDNVAKCPWCSKTSRSTIFFLHHPRIFFSNNSASSYSKLIYENGQYANSDITLATCLQLSAICINLKQYNILRFLIIIMPGCAYVHV